MLTIPELYVYRDTPVPIHPACSLRDKGVPKHEGAGAAILGVSVDSVKSHEEFAAKHNLLFPILSDEDQSVMTAYGVWKEKSTYGKTYMGTERTTFAIDKQGIIRKVWPNVKVEGHVDEVLELVKSL